MSAILFNSAIGPIPVSVVIRESHTSSLGITENPIESGAKVTDHAYVEPKKVSLDFADQSAAETYNTLVQFQQTRQPFTLVTGLYVYTNMLIKSLSADRDERFSRVLSGKAELQEIIIVETAYVADDSEAGKGQRGKPGGKNSTRSAAPSKDRANGTVTKDRASGSIQRGDTPATSVDAGRNQSLLSRGFGL